MSSLDRFDNPLARSRRNPYSRVLGGPHLSDALELPAARPARRSSKNRPAVGGLIRNGAWRVDPPTMPQPPAGCRDPRSFSRTGRATPSFSTEFTAFTRKKKEAKKKEAATATGIQIAPIGALNTYKGGLEGVNAVESGLERLSGGPPRSLPLETGTRVPGARSIFSRSLHGRDFWKRRKSTC